MTAKSEFIKVTLDERHTLVAIGETDDPQPDTQVHVAVMRGTQLVFNANRRADETPWRVGAPAGGIGIGDEVHACGVAVEFTGGRFETFTWMQRLEVTDAEPAAP